ncbi:hypothetical protein SLA2020_228340 [Shorea laevis]
MGFWGIEVKPGKPHPYHSDNVPGTLHITQATLGLGSSSERSILQCSVGHKNPIFLCSLLPDKNESCPLSLEFGDEDDVVAFSVIGPRSIHLSGYFVADDGDHLRDEYDSDSYGEEFAEIDSDGSSDYDTEDKYGDFDDEDEDDDDDGDLDDFHVLNSSAPKSGVVIEEIVDDEKPANGKVEPTREKKKKQSNDYEGKSNTEHQLVVRKATGEPVLESEDEDGFPVSASHIEAQGTDKKRKVKSTVEDDQQERKKKKKKQKEKGTDNINGASQGKIQPQEVEINDKIQISPVENEADQKPSSNKAVTDTNSIPSENLSEKKKKKKKKKKNQESEVDDSANQTVSASGDKNTSTLKTEEKQSAVKLSQVRTFPNGLVIEELVMGKPDGKRASHGKQVSVHYIGRLKKNGKIFDSNVGRAPFKFRLGVGQVIKGWDVGVEGMRIGDKRKLTIPPSMGYGSQGAGGKIPPNSWLEFDVELIDVR